MRHGQRRGGRLFTLHVRSAPTAWARLGIAVGRRVSPRASDRNTIKRIVRDCFRHQAPTLPPLDVVFVFRHGAAAVTRRDLRHVINDALTRLAP